MIDFALILKLSGDLGRHWLASVFPALALLPDAKEIVTEGIGIWTAANRKGCYVVEALLAPNFPARLS